MVGNWVDPETTRHGSVGTAVVVEEMVCSVSVGAGSEGRLAEGLGVGRYRVGSRASGAGGAEKERGAEGAGGWQGKGWGLSSRLSLVPL